MGAENSLLKSCELGEPLDVDTQDWSIHPGRRSDGSKVTVFVNKNKEEEDEEHIKNATRQLKILRHPTILKFFDCCKNLEGTFLITEQVQPLELALERLSPEEICSGLFNIVEALAFLHDKGGVSHNNVSIAAIYVSSKDGGWRLGGMEHVCKFEDATVSFLNQCREQRLKRAIPPEEQDETMKTSIAPDIGHARDAYAFGVLIQEMLEHIGNLGEMTESFNEKMERDFLNEEPKLRPKLSTLLNDPFFKNDFLVITRFLHNITIKTESEKNLFFEGLAPRLFLLPQHLVATKIMPLLLTSFAIAEPVAVSLLLPHVLTPVKDSSKRGKDFDPQIVNPILSEELFKEHVIPSLLQMFPSREIHVRHVLLQFFSGYVHLFEQKVLKGTILPLLLVGLKDTNNDMVAWNLRGLADLVPFLGASVVVGGQRVRYFVEGRPKFPDSTSNSNKALAKQGKQLTAVSGVITIPRMTPTSPPQPLPIYKTEEHNRGPVEDTSDARKLEREEKREEMRLKNEQRRKEREEERTKKQEPETSPMRIGRSLENRLLSSGINDGDGYSGDPDRVDVDVEKETLLTEGDQEIEDSGWIDWEGEGESEETFEPIEGTLADPVMNIQSSGTGDSWDESWNNDKYDWSVGDDVSKMGSNTLDTKASKPHVSERIEQENVQASSKSKDGFGGLYEIPEIKLNSSTSTELDFFADMEPDFHFQTKQKSDSNSREVPKSSSSPAESSVRASTPSENLVPEVGHAANFDTQVSVEEPAGWGEDEDLDLDVEDF